MRRSTSLALLLALTACGSSETATTAAATSSGGTTTGGATSVPCDGAPAALSLGGTWAAYGRLSISFVGAAGGAITICPTDQIGEATMLLLMSVEQDAADATKLSGVRATLCSIELPVVTALVGDCNPASEGLVSTQIIAPPAMIAALPHITTDAVGGTLSSAEAGAALAIDRFTVTVGSTKSGASMPSWALGDPACASASVGHGEACDTSCVDDCAALRDDDDDGYPGVTAEVCGLTPSDESSSVPCNAASPGEPGATLQGRAFLDIQVDPAFTGTAESSCELSGTVDSGVLYNIVGADITLAGGPLTVASTIKSLPAFSVDAPNSKFRMIRVDGQYGAPDWDADPADTVAACAALNAHINDL